MINPVTQDDFGKYRYVIYARKSTEEKDRQLRSLSDQVRECQELAKRNGLRVVSIIREEKSAKAPHKRKDFSELLNKLKAGKVDGIIAWAPDRLARNMLEAGMIIDMIDNEKIKDLRFATYPFSKDANGLMLLGMSFVLSKQYSDKLSQDVMRGTSSKFMEGKSIGASKHGYRTDEDDYYVPDDMFPLLRTAWEKRMLGESLMSIVSWLNDSGYVRKYKSKKNKVVRVSKQRLSRIFNDPFYYGINKRGTLQVDLKEIPETNFKPMVTQEEFIATQKMARTGKISYLRQKTRFGLLPLRGIVKCSECGISCAVYPSRGKGGQRYLYYTCRSLNCTRRNEATRARVVFDWLYEFLKDGFDVTKKDYEALIRHRKQNIVKIGYSLDAEIRNMEVKVKELSATIDNISMKLLSLDSPVARKSVEKQLDQKEEELETLQGFLEKKKETRSNLATVDISWLKFVNISRNLADILKSGNKVQKDALVRIMFVNIFVNRNEVVKYDLKEPFLALLKMQSHKVVSSGGDGGTRTRDLLRDRQTL